jgi:cytochrome P450
MQYLNRLQMPFGDLVEKIPILPINKGFKTAKKELDSIVYNMIKEHKVEEEQIEQAQQDTGISSINGNADKIQGEEEQQLEQSNKKDNEKIKPPASSSHKDLLYTLIQAQDSEQGIGKMSETQLRDEVMTIFLAGHETTANALTWTFYLLSQYPVIEERLFEELSTVLSVNAKSTNGNEARLQSSLAAVEVNVNGDSKNNNPGSPHDNTNNSNNNKWLNLEDEDNNSSHQFSIRLPTIDDLPKLEYTEKVLRESMRIFPPAWTIGRQAVKDYNIDRYTIASGSIILMSQYVMHHNPKYYPNPELFYPDRWTKKFKSSLPRFAYFPFGGGIRGCVGEPFAWIEGILLLATICSRWKMHHDPSHRVEMRPLITLRPKYGMRIKLERRQETSQVGT